MRCATVQILGTGICQLDGNRTVAEVPREVMRRITLCHEQRCRLPFLRFFAGFALIATGLILLVGDFLLAEGGVFHLKMKSATMGIPVLPIVLWSMIGVGVWLVRGVFRGHYIISIQTDRDVRNLYFEERTDIRDILHLIKRANEEMGYDIDLSIMQTMHLGPGDFHSPGSSGGNAP